MAKIRVQSADFNGAEEAAALRVGHADIGALVTFVGLCRSEAGELAALELEHYPGMAEIEIGRVSAEAERRWPLLGLTVIHRVGRIAAGEQIVLIVTAAAHRAPAFAAANFLMDFLKTKAPFWKKTLRSDGSSADWVAAKSDDEEAAARWR